MIVQPWEGELFGWNFQFPIINHGCGGGKSIQFSQHATAGCEGAILGWCLNRKHLCSAPVVESLSSARSTCTDFTGIVLYCIDLKKHKISIVLSPSRERCWNLFEGKIPLRKRLEVTFALWFQRQLGSILLSHKNAIILRSFPRFSQHIFELPSKTHHLRLQFTSIKWYNKIIPAQLPSETLFVPLRTEIEGCSPGIITVPASSGPDWYKSFRPLLSRAGWPPKSVFPTRGCSRGEKPGPASHPYRFPSGLDEGSSARSE